MSEKKNIIEDRKIQELDRLKRKNRRFNAVILLGALQIASLALCYYLGHSRTKNHID